MANPYYVGERIALPTPPCCLSKILFLSYLQDVTVIRVLCGSLQGSGCGTLLADTARCVGESPAILASSSRDPACGLSGFEYKLKKGLRKASIVSIKNQDGSIIVFSP